jgi:hypothetical protein
MDVPPAPDHGSSPAPPGDAFRIRVAVLIAIVSIAGAVGAWRASVSSIHAAALDQEGEQQLVQQEQRKAALVGKVANDLQLLARYQGHVKSWRILSTQADRMRPRNEDLAQSFEAQAQGELSQARALRPFFEAATPDFGDERGTVAYDPAFVLRNLEEGDPDLAVLRPDETFEEAHDAHGKTVDLVGVVALFIASVFMLTVAQFTRRGLRELFAVAGILVMVAGFVLFAVVEATL